MAKSCINALPDPLQIIAHGSLSLLVQGASVQRALGDGSSHFLLGEFNYSLVSTFTLQIRKKEG